MFVRLKEEAFRHRQHQGKCILLGEEGDIVPVYRAVSVADPWFLVPGTMANPSFMNGSIFYSNPLYKNCLDDYEWFSANSAWVYHRWVDLVDDLPNRALINILTKD